MVINSTQGGEIDDIKEKQGIVDYNSKNANLCSLESNMSNENNKENFNNNNGRITKTPTENFLNSKKGSITSDLRSPTLKENQCNSLGFSAFSNDINNYVTTKDNSQNSSVDLQILQEWYQKLHTNN